MHEVEGPESKQSDGLTFGRGELPPASFDSGIHASSLGNFLPEVAYRPVPIAWFLAAWVVHSFSLAALALILSGKAAFFTLSTTFLITIAVVRWTFARGMREAGTGWRAATIIALALNWLWVAMLATAR